MAFAFLLMAAAAAAPVDVAKFERPRVLAAAARYLDEEPRTVTAARSPRSAGGPHDFFSEGDYWWPDPKNADDLYVQRDGMTNPDNFVEHRRALMRLSVQVPALAAGWRLTGEGRYALQAGRHLRAWFVDPDTRMAPHLKYAQAIHGIAAGRPQGVIDTLHLVEVARAIEVLDVSPASSPSAKRYADGSANTCSRPLTRTRQGARRQNNHATRWLRRWRPSAPRRRPRADGAARERFKTIIVPGQWLSTAPLRNPRTAVWAFLFNLEAMAARRRSPQRENL